VSEVLARVGDKWTVLVVGLLGNGPMRFSELRQRVDGISQKMLTTTLRILERDVSAPGRCSQPCHRASYELTALGRDLLVPCQGVGRLGHRHRERVDARTAALRTSVTRHPKRRFDRARSSAVTFDSMPTAEPNQNRRRG